MSPQKEYKAEASRNTWGQQGSNSSSGASVGVGFATGRQNGFTIELGMSQGKGKQDGSEVSYNNTHVSGGKAVNVTSGGDLTMKGAVIDAPKVTADVGGNLSIESLQDTSSQVSRQNSSGFNASLCIPPICYGVSTVSGSVASAKANGSYASVTEQSGIKAGAQGFDVNVKGHTDLQGGVISSTQAAIDGKKNSFQTASLATSDIENHSTYKASGYSVSGSVGFMAGGAAEQQQAMSDRVMTDKQIGKASNAAPGGSAGVGSASGSQTSTTKAGISGIAGYTTVRSDDTAPSPPDATSISAPPQARRRAAKAVVRTLTAWAGVYVTNPNGVPIARAGNDVKIVATRGGANSNLRVVSSTIAAGNTGNLAADDDSCLEASSTAATRAAAWVCGGGAQRLHHRAIAGHQQPARVRSTLKIKCEARR